jgi:hypothetical protein
MLKLLSTVPAPGETCGWTDGWAECDKLANEAFVWRDGRFVTDAIHTCGTHVAELLGILLHAKPSIEARVAGLQR